MEHQRIDEGIARKTKKRRAPYRSREAPLALSRVPADLDPEYVLDLYASAPTSAAVARRLNIRRQALVRWIREQRPIEWKAIQIVRAEMRKEDGNYELDQGIDSLAVHRARERVKSAQWDLERLDAANYGFKQEITHTVQPILTIITVAPAVSCTAIEGEVINKEADSEPKLLK
jgi:hypothetical protein